MAMTEKQGGSDLRATITTARPATSRRGSGAPYLHHRPQMVLLGADERSVPDARADREGLVLLPRDRLAAGRHRATASRLQRLKDKCGNKSNASSEVEFYDLHAVDAGRGGPRHPHHHRDGACHAARFRHRLVRPDAPGAQPGDPPHHATAAPSSARLSICRSCATSWPTSPSSARRMMWMSMRLAAALDREHADRAEATAVAHLHAGREILGLQARTAVRRRGARMPWRQRLHRRSPDGAALSRGAAQRHLGGHRQRHLPGRAARDAARAGDGRASSSTRSRKARGADARLDAFTDELERRLAEPRRVSSRSPGASSR